MNRILHGDNLEALRRDGDGVGGADLYRSAVQYGAAADAAADEDGAGRGGRPGGVWRAAVPDGAGRACGRPADEIAGYADRFDDFLGFLRPRLVEAHRVLAATGSLFFHIDYREVHYCKVMLDQVFGRECFQNEIIWAYDYGARATKRWPAKHDTILWYTRDPERYTFNLGESDRIPYMAPGLVGAEKAARGKTPTDVWWHTIVSPTGKEKTGYATQKPLGILERIVRVHSNPGDLVLDFFAGSGTAGEAAAKNGRAFCLVDESAEASAVMEKRLGLKAERRVTPRSSR